MPLNPSDMAAIYAEAFPDERPWTSEEFAELLAQSGTLAFGDTTSFVIGRVTLDEAEIITLATRPASQRSGLARHNLRRFELKAAEAGAMSVFLEVAETNTAAMSLYRAAGYSVSGRRKDYYRSASGQKTSALLMRKPLT